MSSRTGPRVNGTDGSDYSHRERVASHYVDSVKWKSKLKLNLSLHLLLIVLGALWISLSYLKIVQYQPQDWQMAWLGTIVPVLFGLASLPKSKHNQMYIYVIGSVVFGFGSMIYGATKYVMVAMEYISEEKKDSNFNMRGHSIKLAVIALLVQMQITGLYYAIKLINAWKSKGEKKGS